MRSCLGIDGRHSLKQRAESVRMHDLVSDQMLIDGLYAGEMLAVHLSCELVSRSTILTLKPAVYRGGGHWEAPKTARSQRTGHPTMSVATGARR
jgi:hypothetical protein